MTRKSILAFPEWVALGTSVIFSPFIVPIVTAVFVIQKHAATSKEVILWLTVVTTFVTIVPILAIVLLFRFSKISNMHLPTKEERLVPLCLILVSMVLGTIILHQIGASKPIIWVCIAYIVNCIVFSVITPLWKISFHTSVTTSCVIVLVLLVNFNLVWLFLLIPLIVWARVYREKHTLLQTIVGTLLATVNTLICFLFLSPLA